MPKAPQYRLNWHAQHQTYELHERTSGHLLMVTPEEPEWFDCLDTVAYFTFLGKLGQFTVRKESRQWGDRYWYAYRRIGSKLTKKYLGRTTDLTLARLEEIAALFADQKVDSSEEVGVEVSLDEKVQDQRRSREATQNNVPTMSEIASISPSTRSSAQHDQLLTIKLHRPRTHSRLVSRSRLVERIQEGMERALILISAPAGFGKTTLLAQCIAVSNTPVAWLTLEQEDNDPMRFPKEDIVLMFDDYHVITAESIHRAMTYLLEHLPPQLHLVLATRADPPLPLSRLRARSQLVEVRAAELRMNANETHTFLHTIMGLDLPPDAFTALESRTEGWIAGLQLAALSLHGRTDISTFLSAFTGSHRFVLDYLSDEVLSQQAVPVQAFLLHTSVLDRLSGPLCDVVIGREGSQVILEALERENLFVISLDDERRWYRYHNLFSDFLKSRLQQAEPLRISELHHRASIWYEQQGLPVEAMQHALVANDVERAADLIEQTSDSSLTKVCRCLPCCVRPGHMVLLLIILLRCFPPLANPICPFLVFCLFPSGRFVPSWLRWMLVGWIIWGLITIAIHEVPGFYSFHLIGFISGLIVIVSAQIYRYFRISTMVERQQTRWVVWGASLAIVSVVGVSLPEVFFPSLMQRSWLYCLLDAPALTWALILGSISIGMAVLRAHLWDIDVLINRSLVYGLLTANLAFLYPGLVIALQFFLQRFFSHTNDVALVASTLTIAALFQPLRGRIQRGIDRRFYRRKYDAAHILDAFRTRLRLRDDVELSTLTRDLLTVVEETMQPAHVSLWLLSPESTEQTARLQPGVVESRTERG